MLIGLIRLNEKNVNYSLNQPFTDQPNLADIKFKNSVRVFSFKNSPVKADVVVTEFCFCTPRILIQRWRHSITTPTPHGLRVSCIQSRISLVRRSCTCRRRAYTSTTLGILLNPTTCPLGIY